MTIEVPSASNGVTLEKKTLPVSDHIAQEQNGSARESISKDDTVNKSEEENPDTSKNEMPCVPQAQEENSADPMPKDTAEEKDVSQEENGADIIPKDAAKENNADAMSKDAIKENDVSQANDIQQPQPPFQVVLIDLKAASRGEIRCVEKPLMGSGDLKYVAVSYRWGELHETLIDTHLGYVANITSFDLHSFLMLCRAMSKERDLKTMDYVWVDAICVDQINPVRRKATIYQMTNIYDRANYIVAVPDLHMQYLKDTNTKIAGILQGSMDHRQYLYHLIKGNFVQLEECDKLFLDMHNVPNDSYLCHLLLNYTDHFAAGFVLCQHHDDRYDAKTALHHIYETNPASRTKVKHHHVSRACRKVLQGIGHKKPDAASVGIAELHKCDKGDGCPLGLFYHHNTDSDDEYDDDDHAKKPQVKSQAMQEQEAAEAWKQRIPERSACIRQSMQFMADLVEDWSTRVWVISEYNIAKRKSSNKMKYWFIQLGAQDMYACPFPTNDFTFFELDFDEVSGGRRSPHPVGGSIKDAGSSNISLTSCVSEISNKATHKSNAVYRIFHDTIQKQLNEQTFLEMILKSKASRNGDRFHAILPSSEYKAKLASKEQVDEWKVNTLCSVKLQLYQWMSMKDKAELFFLSGKPVTTAAVATETSTSADRHNKQLLPTFATSKIQWPPRHSYPTLEDRHYKCNFDLDDPSKIQLIPINGSDTMYKLRILPKEYYTCRDYYGRHQKVIDDQEAPMLRRLLKLDIPDKDTVDLVCIPSFGQAATQEYHDRHDWTTHHVFLVGCFVKNKWIIKQRAMMTTTDAPISNGEKWKHHYINDHHSGFDIY